MSSATFRSIRLGLAVLLAVFSIIVLGIAAHLVSVSNGGPTSVGYTLAVAIITWLIILPIIIIDLLGIGVAFLFIIAELVWTFILMILWVAAAASITDSILPDGPCGSSLGICSEVKALDAFAWLSWITILAWFFILLILSIVSHSRGNRGVWREHVTGTNSFGRGTTTGTTHMSQPYQV